MIIEETDGIDKLTNEPRRRHTAKMPRNRGCFTPIRLELAQSFNPTSTIVPFIRTSARAPSRYFHPLRSRSAVMCAT
jgi:hypothetical protein